MKIWWVTAWDNYYPDGGLDNVKGTFATESEAQEFAELLRTRGLAWEGMPGKTYYSKCDNVAIDNVARLL